MPATITSPATHAASVTSCAACVQTPGELLSRHTVSKGWVSYHRCRACTAVRVVQTPRITWFG